ncbi:hypothetical protein E2C01_062805 [Portunus trituberculatus]|uniref:Uncharacterized protein n=1 Tax=Portunus trituberculatus TaxID=210409 RepID=A0A5B7HC47_PORTR|nr:hypothetical protein [Portunus trituberculatus]
MVEVEVLEWVEAVATGTPLLLLRVQGVLSIVKLGTHFCWGKAEGQFSSMSSNAPHIKLH